MNIIYVLIGLVAFIVSGAMFMAGLTNKDINLLIASGVFYIASALWVKGGADNGENN